MMKGKTTHGTWEDELDSGEDMTIKSNKKANGSSKKKGRPSNSDYSDLSDEDSDPEDDGTPKTPQKGEVYFATPASNYHQNDKRETDFTVFNDPRYCPEDNLASIFMFQEEPAPGLPHIA